MPNHQLFSFPSDDALAGAVADRWLDELAARTNDPAPYCVALSGGRIARKFFGAVAEHAPARQVPFGRLHFFWADERCVPPTDAESNFGLAKAHLLEPLAIPPDRVHRVRGEIAPKWAVAEAEEEICRIAPMDDSGQPVLDLIFLGMGEDGHVASLFPGASEEAVRSKSVYLPVVASKPPPQRITLNYAALAAAGDVWVLASGAGKQSALRESLSADGRTPLARVLQARARTSVFSDIAGAF
jgi:6-phosphogluconolactonase